MYANTADPSLGDDWDNEHHNLNAEVLAVTLMATPLLSLHLSQAMS
jgi:hypothetical protein